MEVSLDINRWFRELPQKLPELLDAFMRPVPLTIFFIIVFIIWRKSRVSHKLVAMLYKLFKVMRVVIVIGVVVLLASFFQHTFYSSEDNDFEENKKISVRKQFNRLPEREKKEEEKREEVIEDDSLFNRYVFLSPAERAFFDPNIENSYNRGITAYKSKRYEKAIDHFSKILSITTQYAFPFCARGIAYAQLGLYQKAMFDFDNAIARNFTVAALFNNRAIIQMEQSRFQGAKLDFDNAIYLNPNFSQLYINRGYLFYVLKKYQKAKDDWEEAISNNQNPILEQWIKKLDEE